MGAHVDDAAGETLVSHRRHGDQHLPIEEALSRSLMCNLGPRASDPKLARRIAACSALRLFSARLRRLAYGASRLVIPFHIEMLPHCPEFANDARRTASWGAPMHRPCQPSQLKRLQSSYVAFS